MGILLENPRGVCADMCHQFQFAMQHKGNPKCGCHWSWRCASSVPHILQAPISLYASVFSRICRKLVLQQRPNRNPNNAIVGSGKWTCHQKGGTDSHLLNQRSSRRTYRVRGSGRSWYPSPILGVPDVVYTWRMGSTQCHGL